MSDFKLDLPPFANEREEADWWFDNQDLIAEMFEVKYGKGSRPVVAADVEGEDAVLLQEQAAMHGMELHVYATKLIHEALHKRQAA